MLFLMSGIGCQCDLVQDTGTSVDPMKTAGEYFGWKVCLVIFIFLISIIPSSKEMRLIAFAHDSYKVGPSVLNNSWHYQLESGSDLYQGLIAHLNWGYLRIRNEVAIAAKLANIKNKIDLGHI